MGGLSSKGRTIDNQPGTRMDGYLHHEYKKKVLQVSRREGLIHARRAG
jgi:hypothetical protein